MDSTNPMFFFPVMESEVEKVAKGLKNRFSMGIDEIPDYVVKQQKTAKEMFSQIYNASLEMDLSRPIKNDKSFTITGI
jgi:hypothetical protein